MGKKYKSALVVGGGAFGTSIATVLAHKFEKVVLKVRSPYNPALSIPSNISPVLSWEEVDQLTGQGEDLNLVVNDFPLQRSVGFIAKIKSALQIIVKRECPLSLCPRELIPTLSR